MHARTYSTVAPQQVFYAQTPPEEEIESVQDLGPEITTTFVVSFYVVVNLYS